MMGATLTQRSQALMQAWAITQEMLIAAHQGQWDKLVALQDDRHSVLQVLADMQAPFLADDVSCIHKMLHADPELASLTLAGRGEIARLIKEFAVGHSMAQTYAGNSGL